MLRCLAIMVLLYHWDKARLEIIATLSIKDDLEEWMVNYEGIWIEGDNVNVIKLFQKFLSSHFRLDAISDSLDLSFPYDFKRITFNCISRDENKVANCCITYALSGSFFWKSVIDSSTSTTTIMAEIKALQCGLRLCISLGITKLWIEVNVVRLARMLITYQEFKCNLFIGLCEWFVWKLGWFVFLQEA
ncbi:hypothetical protein M5K25_026534 [Dendrobium thyrsiflorum]|uniref:RNase H type-1 domain-containing protein n=1 Tax=Dendrobium thyrsiflorum TaxID=117978 RepID=A0ABD0TXS4_DENTH